jgi:hypothetical protein
MGRQHDMVKHVLQYSHHVLPSGHSQQQCGLLHFHPNRLHSPTKIYDVTPHNPATSRHAAFNGVLHHHDVFI